jgi:hypothetical protein
MVERRAAAEKGSPSKVAQYHHRCILATHFFSARAANLVHMLMRFLFYKLSPRFIE